MTSSTKLIRQSDVPLDVPLSWEVLSVFVVCYLSFRWRGSLTVLFLGNFRIHFVGFRRLDSWVDSELDRVTRIPLITLSFSLMTKYDWKERGTVCRHTSGPKVRRMVSNRNLRKSPRNRRSFVQPIYTFRYSLYLRLQNQRRKESKISYLWCQTFGIGRGGVLFLVFRKPSTTQPQL